MLDVLIYFPFIRVYDRTLLAEEKAKEDVIEGQDTAVLAADTVAPQTAEVQVEASEMADEKPAAAHDESFFKNNEIDVLVLCAGGGTSGILANALNKLSKERGLKVVRRGSGLWTGYGLDQRYEYGHSGATNGKYEG